MIWVDTDEKYELLVLLRKLGLITESIVDARIKDWKIDK